MPLSGNRTLGPLRKDRQCHDAGQRYLLGDPKEWVSVQVL